ncbi:hypothetical protein PENSTE_c003G00669 [Penicillium steckii]|uniref:Uncharacterized protein n=1 Tax=Penicillium steckii TaxID=303698 RepID=A0A1V6TRX0_9EURO|nr:hypothetical protein PENSTE_c003G00669 [Penicillium steckii]
MTELVMDEKYTSRGSSWSRQKDLRPKNHLIVALFIMCCYLSFYGWSGISQAKDGPNYFEYSDENINWKPCNNSNSLPLECSSIKVPIDQFDLEHPRNETFIIPLIRMRGINATQNLFLNPGGPGASGFDLLHRRGEQLKAIIGEGFHLVSFDPRGVNNSVPRASCYPDERTRQELSRVRSLDVLSDSPEVFAWAKNFIQACPDTMGEYAKYLNTPQTAADMNDILDALGQEDMIYWGFSYGSLLGQTYAGLFPERSKRIIIDGVIDQFDWYGGLFEAQSLVDTDMVLDGFFEECVKSGPERCPLARMAATKKELRGKVLSSMTVLQDQPISVYINKSIHGLLDYEKLWFNGVFPALHKPSMWSELAHNMYNVFQGNATDAFLAYGNQEAQKWRHEAFEFITLNDGISGPEHWPQDRQTFLDKIAPLFNLSLFSPVQSKNYYLRQQWTVSRTHSYVPRKNMKTAHPLLILSTTYDPVCPLIAAKTANEAFEGSKIVEVSGYGHCSIAVPSLCLAKYVRAFLYEGRLPHTYTQCEVDSPYFHESDKSGQSSPQRVFEDTEEAEIHLAQVLLADGWDFASAN